MSGSSAIEWTDATWNPVTGCTRVSPGCARCYIERTPPFRMAGRRFELAGGAATTGVQLHTERLEQPLAWRKPRRVFVNSLSDLFHEDVPFDFIDRVFGVMWLARRHTFQVLTKRPERARQYLDRVVMVAVPSRNGRLARSKAPIGFVDWEARRPDLWPLPNVWLGVSIENARFTWRAEVLREIPAAVRFVSAEPLLGSLFDKPRVTRTMEDVCDSAPIRSRHRPLDLMGIDWVIVGGESGPGARGMDLAWAREITAACIGARVAYFVKQLGAQPYEVRTWVESGESYRSPLHLKSKKGGDPDEWPADLRVREFPRSAVPA